MTCVVTGGFGFIGSHLVDRLLLEKHTVRIIDSRSDRLIAARGPCKNLDVVGASDADKVRNCLKHADVLFHFAGSLLPNASNKAPVEDVTSTLAGSVRLLVHAVDGGVRKVVFASSGGTVYGIPKQVPISESHPTDPISSYGIVKLSIEKYLALFESMHDLQYVALRFSNPYGEGQDPFRNFGAVASFLGAAATDEPIQIMGDGTVVRDFLYIEDAVDAILRAANYTGCERIFNIGSASGTSLNQLLGMIRVVTGVRTQVSYLPARRADVPIVILDIARAQRELEWSPSTSLVAGVARTWAWCTDRFADISPARLAQVGRGR